MGKCSAIRSDKLNGIFVTSSMGIRAAEYCGRGPHYLEYDSKYAEQEAAKARAIRLGTGHRFRRQVDNSEAGLCLKERKRRQAEAIDEREKAANDDKGGKGDVASIEVGALNPPNCGKVSCHRQCLPPCSSCRV